MHDLNLIDDPIHLYDARVFIFSGLQDKKYPEPYQIAQRDYYLNFGANVDFVQLDVGHAFPAIYSPNEGIAPSGA